MSSTNVHSNLYVCGGETIAISPEKGIDMPPKNAGRGPKRLDVIEGEKAVIPALVNVVVKEGKKTVARATYNENKNISKLQENDINDILFGDLDKVKKAIGGKTSKTSKSNRKNEDMEK